MKTKNEGVDLLEFRIPTPNLKEFGEEYYQNLLDQCEAQIADATALEVRFETISATLTARKSELEIGLIAAWDNPDEFGKLSSDYQLMSVVFDIAPMALAYHRERAHRLRLKKGNLSRYLSQSIREAAAKEREIALRAEKARLLAEEQALIDSRLEAKVAEKAEEQAARQQKTDVRAAMEKHTETDVLNMLEELKSD